MPTLARGTRLTLGQMAMYAQAAGLSADKARIAAAVGMAESSGDPYAHNAIPPDNSYGIWQVNMLGSMGPDRRAKLGIGSNDQLYDPAVNARAMAMISGGGANFGPWSTYTSGAYKKYLTGSAATAAGWDPFEDWWNGLLGEPKRGPGSPGWDTDPFGLGELGGDGLGGMGDLGIGDVASGIGSIAELMVGAGKWLGDAHNWVRVAQVVLGAVLVGVGIQAMTSGAIGPAVSKAAAVIPGGGAAKAAAKAAT